MGVAGRHPKVVPTAVSVDEATSSHTQNSSHNIAGVLTGQEHSRGTKLPRLSWPLNGNRLAKVCNLQFHVTTLLKHVTADLTFLLFGFSAQTHAGLQRKHAELHLLLQHVDVGDANPLEHSSSPCHSQHVYRAINCCF